MHEVGHVYAGLDDEYYSSDETISKYGKNCEKPLPGDWEGYSNVFQGCGIGCGDCYRPSLNSIMNDISGGAGGVFNIVSCAHIMSKIKGGAYTKHLDECSILNTV